MSPGIHAALVDYAARLRWRFGDRLRWVRLFGSWARGEARDDSDIDVAVVIEGMTRDEWREAVGMVFDTEMATEVVLTALALSGERFDTLLAQERGIAEDILRDGVAA